MPKTCCIAICIYLAYSRYYYYFLSHFIKLAFSILFIVFHKSSIKNKFSANRIWRHNFHLLLFLIPFFIQMYQHNLRNFCHCSQRQTKDKKITTACNCSNLPKSMEYVLNVMWYNVQSTLWIFTMIRLKSIVKDYYMLSVCIPFQKQAQEVRMMSPEEK